MTKNLGRALPPPHLDKIQKNSHIFSWNLLLRTNIFCPQNILKHPSVNSTILTKREFQFAKFFINVQIYLKTNLGQYTAPEEENIHLLFYSFWIVEYQCKRLTQPKTFHRFHHKWNKRAPSWWIWWCQRKSCKRFRR